MIDEYVRYHLDMIETGDMDPAYGMLRYVCDRFELNVEQRYWVAFLYSATYCGPTAFYIYNEFPDYELVDRRRLENWWRCNRHRVLFQSDRRWVRSRNQFVPMWSSYKSVAGDSQNIFFGSLNGKSPSETYKKAYRATSKIFQMGRFGLFIYTEALHAIAGLEMEPEGLDLKNAESSRNGLCYAIGRHDLITGKETGRKSISDKDISALEIEFERLVRKVKEADVSKRSNVWNIETSLCAFKKYKRTKAFPDTPKQHRRYIGYYLDRQHDEIEKMQKMVPEGVCWDVLWQYRSERIARSVLKEKR